MKAISRIYTALIFVFLYAPIAVMIFFSFNSSISTAVFNGFSFRWYISLFSGSSLVSVLGNSLLVAALATVISTVLGTLAAVGIYRMRNRLARSAVMNVTNIPMMNPDIVTGISLLLFFVFMGRLLGASSYRNVMTVVIAHVTFCLPYVILSVLPKLRQMDKHLTEAALDLGCTPFQSFFKVELPSIMPGVFTGAIMAFTLSLDDFVISNFTCGQGFQTLPVYIYNMIKKRVSLDVYALYTLIFIFILALLIFSNIMQARAEDRNDPHSKLNRRIKKRSASLK